MPGKLTSNGVGKLKRVGKYYDGFNGFFVQVYPTGAKCWQQRLTISGRRRTRGLGGFPAVKLADARAAACENWLLVRAGGDPFSKRPRGVPTFEQAADAVIELHAPTWKDPTSARAWRNTLVQYVFPHFGKVRVSQVDIHHVLAALTPIWDDYPVTARRVRQRIRTILDWAIAMQYRTINSAGPAVHGVLLKNLPADKKKQHFAAVPYAKLPQVLADVRRMKARVRLRLLFEFLVLTAVRSAEACEAQWTEIHLDEATWFIPGDRMKAGFPHRVALSDRAVQILREVRKLHAHSETGLVFPGIKSGKPFSDGAVLGLLRRLSVPGTVHGLRSSFRDWVEETRPQSAEAAERALSHARTNQTVAAYLRTDLLDARRPLMQIWADYVTAKCAAVSGT